MDYFVSLGTVSHLTGCPLGLLFVFLFFLKTFCPATSSHFATKK